MAGNERDLNRDISEGEITAWLEVLKEPTPEEAARIHKVIDQVLGLELGRPPRISSERAAELDAQKGRNETYAREDVQAVHGEITREIDAGTLSVSALIAYRGHLFANHYKLPPTNEILQDLPKVTADSGILDRTHIEAVEQLGPNVNSILFTGTNSHYVALAKRGLPTPQTLHSVIITNLGELQSTISEAQGKLGFGYRVNRQVRP